MQRGSTLPKAGADSLAEVSKLRAVVEEERRLRSVAVAEWSQRCDVLEAWNRKLVGVLAAFKVLSYHSVAALEPFQRKFMSSTSNKIYTSVSTSDFIE